MPVTVNGSGSYADIPAALTSIAQGSAGQFTQDVVIETDNQNEVEFNIGNRWTGNFRLTIRSTYSGGSTITSTGSNSSIKSDDSDIKNLTIENFIVNNSGTADSIVIRNKTGDVIMNNITVNHTAESKRSFFSTDVDKMTLENFIIESDITTSTDTVDIKRCGELNLLNFEVEQVNNGRDLLLIDSDLSGGTSTPLVRIEDSLIEKANRDGIRLINKNEVEIRRTIVKDCKKGAIIQLENSFQGYSTKVVNCLFKNNANVISTTAIVDIRGLETNFLFNTFNQTEDNFIEFFRSADSDDARVLGNIYYYDGADTFGTVPTFNRINLAVSQDLSNIELDYNVYFTTTPNDTFKIASLESNSSNLLAVGSYTLNSDWSDFLIDSGKEVNSKHGVDPNLINDIANEPSIYDIFDDSVTNYTEGKDIRGFNRQGFYVSAGAYDFEAEDGTTPADDVSVSPEGIKMHYIHDGNSVTVHYSTNLQGVFQWFKTNNYYKIENAAVSKFNGIYFPRVGTVDPLVPSTYGVWQIGTQWYQHTGNSNIVAVNIGTGGNDQWVIIDKTDSNGVNKWYKSDSAASSTFATTAEYDRMVNASTVDMADAGTYDITNDNKTGMYPYTEIPLNYDHICYVNTTSNLGNLFHTSPKGTHGIIEITLDSQQYNNTPFPSDTLADFTNYDDGYSLWITGTQNLIFDKCMLGSKTFGCRIGPDVLTNSVRFTNCIFSDTTYGISVESSDGVSFDSCKIINCTNPIYLVNSTNVDLKNIDIDYDETTTYATSQADASVWVSDQVSKIKIMCQIVECRNLILDNVNFDIRQYFTSYDFSNMFETIKFSSSQDVEIYRCLFNGNKSGRYIWAVATETADFGVNNILIDRCEFTPILEDEQNHAVEYMTFYGGFGVKVTNCYFEFIQNANLNVAPSKNVKNIFIYGTKNSRDLQVHNCYFRAERGTVDVSFPINEEDLNSYYILWEDDGVVVDIGNNAFEGNANYRGLISFGENPIVNGVILTESTLTFTADGLGDNTLTDLADYSDSSYLVLDQGGKINDVTGTLNASLYNLQTRVISGVLIGNGDSSYAYSDIDIRNFEVDTSSFDISPVSSTGTAYVPPPISVDVELVISKEVNTVLGGAPYNQTLPTGVVKPTLAGNFSTGKYLIPEQEKFTLLSNVEGDYKYVVWEIKDSSTGEIILRNISVNRSLAFDEGTQATKHTIRTVDVSVNTKDFSGNDAVDNMPELLTVVQARPKSKANINKSFVYASQTGENEIVLNGESSDNYDVINWKIQDKNLVEQTYNNQPIVSGLIYDVIGEYDVELAATNTTDSDNILIKSYIKSLSDSNSPVVQFKINKFIIHEGQSVELRNTSIFLPTNYTLNWYILNARDENSIVTENFTYTKSNLVPTDNQNDESISLTLTEYGEFDVVLEITNDDDGTMVRKYERRFFVHVPAKTQGTTHTLDINNYNPVAGDPTYETQQFSAVNPTHFGGVSAGDSIEIRGGIYRNIYFDGFVGTEENPIIISNSDGERVIVDRSDDPREASAGISMRNCRHVYVVGGIYENKTSTTLGDEMDWDADVKPVENAGLKDPSNTQFGICIRNGNSRGVRCSGDSSDIAVYGLEVANAGFAGMEFKQDPNGDQPEFWDQYYRFYNLRIGYCVVHHSHGEALYLGFSAWYIKNSSVTSDRTATFNVRRNVSDAVPYNNGDSITLNLTRGQIIYNKPHSLIATKIFRNKLLKSGWDGFQIGCGLSRTEVHNNDIIDSGTAAVWGQNSCVSLNHINGDFYNNRLNIGTTGNSLAVYGKVRIFNNTMANMGDDSRMFYIHFNDEKYEFTQLFSGTLTSGYPQDYLNSCRVDPDIDDDNKAAKIHIFNNTAMMSNAPLAINPKDLDITNTIEEILFFNNLLELTPAVFIDNNANPKIAPENIRCGRIFYTYGHKTPDGSLKDCGESIPNYNNTDYGDTIWEYYENRFFLREDVDASTIKNPRFANYYNGDLRLLPNSPYLNGGIIYSLKDNNIKINYNADGKNRNLLSNINFGAYGSGDWTVEGLVVGDIAAPTDCDTCHQQFFPNQIIEINDSELVHYILWSETRSVWIMGTALAVDDIDHSVAPDNSGDTMRVSSLVILRDATRVNAPLTQTSSGKKGDIRYDTKHIYFCVVDNFWVKTAIINF